jgi:mitochondrial distribution and morphology protein 31
MLSRISSGGRLLNLQTTRTLNVAALDRYRIIRDFFRKQHTVAPELLLLSSRRLVKSPKLTKRPCDRETNLIPNQRRSFHPSILRPFPENYHKKHEGETRTLENAKPPSSDPLSKQEPYIPPPPNDENYSRFFQRLALSLPHLHRPTRDDFLNVATGFWERIRIRFKWFTIKSFRKFNADDISAFITWFVMSQTLWILVGT